MIDSDLIFKRNIDIILNKEKNVNSSIMYISKGDKHYAIDKSKVSLHKFEFEEISNIPIFKNSNSSVKISTHGIIGIVEGVYSNYLMYISKAHLVGIFLKSKILQIKEISFISLESDSIDLINSLDDDYLQMIRDFTIKNNLYFSDNYDLTNTLVENFNNPKNIKMNLKSKIKSHFCWNFNFISLVSNCNCLGIIGTIIPPIINGYISISMINCNNEKDFDYIVISRKDARRSGCRFFYRGCDEEGNVSNFVETEQIVVFLEDDSYNVLSYTQIRGSIPLYWKQPSNLLFVPKISFPESISYKDQLKVYNKHISDLTSNYGKVILVNLIDKKPNRDQNTIGKIFQNVHNESKDELKTNYVWFDFHNECKNMKYEKLKKLINIPNIQNNLNIFDINHIVIPLTFNFSDYNNKEPDENFESEILTQQNGVFRTNCIDCLDRTNIVQTLFARLVLHKILFKLKISKEPSGEIFEPFERNLENTFRNVWADNGDIISKSYAGTPAQKSDFTRKGVRTIKGALNDFKTGATRFYINNFMDGYNQDCHDYFLGKFSPKKYIFQNRKKINKQIFGFMIASAVFLSFAFFFSVKSAVFITENKENKIHQSIINLIFNFALYIPCLLLSIRSALYIAKNKINNNPIIY